MSHGRNYDNNKNHVQLISNLVESLNEALAAENASVDRIISRIDQTPIHRFICIIVIMGALIISFNVTLNGPRFELRL
jgi:t-SNARE complex subunit (syntaxin)